METPETPLNPEENPHVPPKREIPEKAPETPPQFFQPDNHPVITLNADSRYFLYTAGRWASFLAIMGFILSGLIAIIAIFAGSVFATLGRLGGSAAMPAGVGGLITVIYLMFAVIHFFFALYLYQFATRIKDGITYMNEQQVTSALGKLKTFFKYWGILVIVILSIYILAIIGVIIAAPMLKNSLPTGNAYSFIF